MTHHWKSIEVDFECFGFWMELADLWYHLLCQCSKTQESKRKKKYTQEQEFNMIYNFLIFVRGNKPTIKLQDGNNNLNYP